MFFSLVVIEATMSFIIKFAVGNAAVIMVGAIQLIYNYIKWHQEENDKS